MEMLATPEFWIAVGQIILIDILLGGDNAVVIALACRSLPPQQRTKGIIWGTAGAIVLRVILIFFALTLLQIPFLKIVGALLLVWIGVKLLLPEDEGGGHGDIAASDKLWGAVKTVIVADLVMSVDNVIAIAGAAESAGGDHTMPLVIFGLLVSIPIIVWGSQLVLKLMDRFPLIITAGGMLLGWIAGTMAVTDPALAGWMPTDGADKPQVLDSVRYGAGLAGALLVYALGKWFASRRGRCAACSWRWTAPPDRSPRRSSCSRCARNCATARPWRPTWSTSSARCPRTWRDSSPARPSRNTTARTARRPWRRCGRRSVRWPRRRVSTRRSASPGRPSPSWRRSSAATSS